MYMEGKEWSEEGALLPILSTHEDLHQQSKSMVTGDSLRSTICCQFPHVDCHKLNM